MHRREREQPERSRETDEDLERYESWRHKRARVPSRSYIEYTDRGTRPDGPQLGGSRGGVEYEDWPDEGPFQSHVHGGDPTDGTEDYGQIYRGRMRRYRRVGDRFMAEPGPHRGMGPRGYRRSDERIREDVCDMLLEDGLLDASGIEVETHDGEVELKGTVASRRAKRRAEDLAETVYGVRDVHNRLVLQESSRA